MKVLLSILVGLVVFWLVFFKIDPAIISWVMSNVPESASEWFGLIKIGVWLVVVGFTAGLGIWLSLMVGGILEAIKLIK